MNIKNNFTLIGRLLADPDVFDNTNGSKKVKLTLSVKDNFKSGKDQTVGDQKLRCEAYITPEAVKASGIGRYGLIHSGDLVAVSGSINNNDYTDKDGNAVYGIALKIENLEMMEPKSVTDARAIRKAQEKADAAAAPAADAQ